MMDLFSMLAVAVALAMDAFAVAIAAGMVIAPLTHRHIFRLSFHFGLFQFLMPIVGWFAGRTVAGAIDAWDHWVAFFLLAGIGCKMLYESWADHGSGLRTDPTRGLALVMFAVATSIDALAVGLSIALLDVSIWIPSVIIGLIAAAMTWAGMVCGNRISRWGQSCGRWAERVGGVVLIVLAIRILASHVWI